MVKMEMDFGLYCPACECFIARKYKLDLNGFVVCEDCSTILGLRLY